MQRILQFRAVFSLARPTFAVLLSSVLLLSTWACGQDKRDGVTGGTISALSHELVTAGQAAIASELRAAKKDKKKGSLSPKKDKSDEDKDNIDYWKGVQFDIHNFDEVLDYLSTYYIDEHVHVQRAWTAAANGALSILSPEAELLPKTFYDARHAQKDEEGRLDGHTGPFVCDDEVIPGLIIHRIPSPAYLRSKQKDRERRLSDEEIRKLRAMSKQRYAAYRAAWSKLTFNRATFKCVMKLIGQELKNKKGHAKWLPSAVIKKIDRGLRVQAGDKRVGLYDEDLKEDTTGYRPPAPDLNRAWLAAASSYLYALDPHSSIISRTAWDESTRQTQDASFEGIGAVLYQRGDVTIIENPMEGLPAWRAKIRAGDRIIKVDGTDVRGWMLGKVVKLIRGPKNTKVVLTIKREGRQQPFDVPIVRARIAIKNVRGKLLKDYPGVAQIKMSGFVPRSARDLRDMIEKLASEAPEGKLTGLILDLRRNSGGLLTRAIDIADMFLRRGRIVSVKSRRKSLGSDQMKPEENHDAHDQASDLSMPLVVLVNDGSASASEIVASAIQENGRGLVLGLRTFGKASVQTLFEPALHLDYYIKLTVARYYAPSGGTIQVTGVHPDVIVPPKPDGKIPVGFREENLTNHLEPVAPPKPSPWAKIIPELKRCIAKTGHAFQIVKQEKNPQIRPDFQVMTAADYLHCLQLRQTSTVSP